MTAMRVHWESMHAPRRLRARLRAGEAHTELPPINDAKLGGAAAAAAAAAGC